MVEKFLAVKNPLTIIAIFAGIAEISGTAVLPFVHPHYQEMYIWFLIIFPSLLILLFFVTLNFNHKVLYAPSDFKNEDNFMGLLGKATPRERVEKIKQEANESNSYNATDTEDSEESTTETQEPECRSGYHEGDVPKEENDYKPSETCVSPDGNRPTNKKNINTNQSAIYLMAEELALSKLQDEFKYKIEREVAFNLPNKRFIFDGMILKGPNIIGIEIKYAKDIKFINVQIKRTLNKMQEVYSEVCGNSSMSFKLVLAIVSEFDQDQGIIIKNNIQKILYLYSFPVDIRLYNFHDLENEFGLK